MINGIKKGTIVSTTEDRLTLLNWLKKLEKTLSDDTLTDIAFNDDNGNVSLVLTFEDGTTKSVAFPYDMSKFALSEELDNIWSVVPGQDFKIREQHSFKIGNVIFTHVNGYTSNTGLGTYNYFLKTNKIPTHAHLFGLYDATGRITAEFTTTGYVMAYAAIGQDRTNIDFEFFYSSN